MIKLFTLLLLLAFVGRVQAQDELEYKMEVGAGVGVLTYQGDFNGSIAKNPQAAVGVVLKRVFNPYMALSLQAATGKIKGSSAGLSTYYPAYEQAAYSFTHNLTDVSVFYEYNFWPYGTGRDYRGAKPLTPYIFAGLGVTFVSGGPRSVAAAHLPIGVGVKYKVGKRVNLSLQWITRFTTSDELDGVKDPYGVTATGVFKNKDGYSALMATVTYSFMAKCRTCNKD